VPRKISPQKISIARWLLAALFVIAGAMHFILPAAYERILPPFLPQLFLSHRFAVIALTGVAEIAGGLGLLWEPTRRAAAISLALLLIAVFPANLWMATSNTHSGVAQWALWLRLPLQLPLIWWALLYSKREPATIPSELPS
jgi:uncharacterized membrane protein